MNTFMQLFPFIDTWLITPFRLPLSPEAGFLLGSAILALQCVALGKASAMLATSINRRHLQKIQQEMDRYHHLSETALQLGDKKSFKAVNSQALDAFGHSFSMGGALFCISIWPLPFALAWMSGRFAAAPLQLPVSLPFIGDSVNYFTSFLLLYIVVRLLSTTAANRLRARRSRQIA